MKLSQYNVVVDDGDERLVYNGRSGALLRVGSHDWSQVTGSVESAGLEACDPALLQKLVAGRMLVTDDCDEVAMLSRRYAASRRSREHLGLTIVTSLGCNFDCPYCFEDKHPSVLNQSVQRALVAYVDEALADASSMAVSWYGGEPLIGKRPLLSLSDAFIERCDQRGVSYDATMVSNGSLLDRATCEALRERRVSFVQVTLDGPPDVHDLMRPLVKGGPTFELIMANLVHAVEYFDIAVRVNVDHRNVARAEELLEILCERGLAGRLSVYLGQLIAVDDGAPAPSTTYGAQHCMTGPQFAQAETEFAELSARYGFGMRSVPTPTATPCTAVRANELIIGSHGELYKCYDSVGNPSEIVGSIFNFAERGGRMQRWLNYDPFSDEECRSCIALPVCMGGCAHHAMAPELYDNRCDTFRHNYRQRIEQVAHERVRAQPSPRLRVEKPR